MSKVKSFEDIAERLNELAIEADGINDQMDDLKNELDDLMHEVAKLVKPSKDDFPTKSGE